VVRHILNLAATEWLDEHGLTWLQVAPKIKLLPEPDQRSPYPLSWEEQERLFRELPVHLARMALFLVNTGCREQVAAGLRWDWEVSVPEMGVSVFLVPANTPGVKNKRDLLVVLNRTARAVVDVCRGIHPEWVFTYQGHRILRVNNTAWKGARARAAETLEEETGRPAPDGYRRVRVHDLKHTFGRRLRAAGVSFEDRQDLLGHKSGRITTHYSAAEVGSLIAAAERVCGDESRKSPALVLLKSAVSL
jgi:integrase